MTSQRVTVRKIDITRAVQAARAGGMSIGRIEIENGKIVIVSGSEAVAMESPLDKWLKSNESN